MEKHDFPIFSPAASAAAAAEAAAAAAFDACLGSFAGVIVNLHEAPEHWNTSGSGFQASF